MIATNSRVLPMDRTDIREKRERKKGRMGREVEKWTEGRIQPPFSLFHPLLPSPLSSLLHTVFTMPFQYKMRIKLPLHIRHGTPFSWVSLYENAVHNIPMTTVMYCTNTHWIRMMIRTIYGEGRAGEGGQRVHTPPSFSVHSLKPQLQSKSWHVWQVFHLLTLIKLTLYGDSPNFHKMFNR